MKKVFVVMALVLVLALVSTACGGGKSDVVKITFMKSKTEIQSDLQTVVDDFNEKNEGIEVELLGTSGDNYATVLQSNFAADPATAPTIFSMSGPDTVNFEKFMAPLDDTEAAKLLPDNLKDAVVIDDKLIGLPSAVEGYGLIYNADMLSDAGIDPASLNSIDALVSAFEKLATVEGVDAPLGFAKENYFIFIHFFNWGAALDPDYSENLAKVGTGEQTLADIPSIKQWADDLDKIKEFTNKGLVSYDDQVAGFSAGKYAMIHQGVWAQQVIDQNEVEFDYGFIPYPTGGNDKLAVGTATAWSVNNEASEEQQKAAKTFLDWLITSDEGQKHSADLLNFIPAYTGVKAPAGNLTESVAEYAGSGKTVGWVYNTDFPSGMDVDGTTSIQKYYADQIDSAGLLQELSDAWVKNYK